MPLRCGVEPDLEERALDILKADRARQSRQRLQGADWFTPDQYELRESKEILVSPHLLGSYPTFYGGLYKRAYNPQLNRRPTVRNLSIPGMDPWNQLVWEEMDNYWYHPGQFVSPGINAQPKGP